MNLFKYHLLVDLSPSYRGSLRGVSYTAYKPSSIFTGTTPPLSPRCSPNILVCLPRGQEVINVPIADLQKEARREAPHRRPKHPLVGGRGHVTFFGKKDPIWGLKTGISGSCQDETSLRLFDGPARDSSRDATL